MSRSDFLVILRRDTACSCTSKRATQNPNINSSLFASLVMATMTPASLGAAPEDSKDLDKPLAGLRGQVAGEVDGGLFSEEAVTPHSMYHDDNGRVLNKMLAMRFLEYSLFTRWDPVPCKNKVELNFLAIMLLEYIITAVYLYVRDTFLQEFL